MKFFPLTDLKEKQSRLQILEFIKQYVKAVIIKDISWEEGLDEFFMMLTREMPSVSIIPLGFGGSGSRVSGSAWRTDVFQEIGTDLRNRLGKRNPKIFCALRGGGRERLKKKSGLTEGQHQEILSYFLLGGLENHRNLLLYLASTLGRKRYTYNPPQGRVWEGIYAPDLPEGRIEDETSYLASLKRSGKPVIGILFHSHYLQEQNLEYMQQQIRIKVDVFRQALQAG